MTVNELFSVQRDEGKLRSLYIKLARLEDFNPYKGNVITDMPAGCGGKNFSEWYAEETEQIEREIESCKEKLKQDTERVEAYINVAPYPECDIIRYRVINNLSWEEIGAFVGYTRRWVSHRFWEYIKTTENTKNTA